MIMMSTRTIHTDTFFFHNKSASATGSFLVTIASLTLVVMLLFVLMNYAFVQSDPRQIDRFADSRQASYDFTFASASLFPLQEYIHLSHQNESLRLDQQKVSVLIPPPEEPWYKRLVRTVVQEGFTGSHPMLSHTGQDRISAKERFHVRQTEGPIVVQDYGNLSFDTQEYGCARYELHDGAAFGSSSLFSERILVYFDDASLSDSHLSDTRKDSFSSALGTSLARNSDLRERVVFAGDLTAAFVDNISLVIALSADRSDISSLLLSDSSFAAKNLLCSLHTELDGGFVLSHDVDPVLRQKIAAFFVNDNVPPILTVPDSVDYLTLGSFFSSAISSVTIGVENVTVPVATTTTTVGEVADE